MSSHDHDALPEMFFCKKCTHPNTRPRIRFTKDRICNGCLRAEQKKGIDWKAKEEEFKRLTAEIVLRSPDRKYDCIIPVSGGKDSTFQAWYAVNVLGLTTLCVNIAPFLPTEVGVHNLRNLAERLPVDVISFIPNQSVFTRLTRQSMEAHGDPYTPFLFLVYAGIARIAVEKKIPLILFGENGETEYAGSNDREFVLLDNKGVASRIKSDKVNFKEPRNWVDYGFAEHEVAPYVDPSDEEMAAIGLQRLFFSDYTPWTNNHHLHIALNVVGGFEMADCRAPGTFTFGYSTDDDLYDVYIWLLWPKFGFCRATKYTSKDIQEGKIKREETLPLVRDYDGEFPWDAVDRFCGKTGMSLDQFWDVVESFVGDEDNLRREAKAHGVPMKIPAWEKIGPRTWRLRAVIHGEERLLTLPLERPIANL